MINNARKAVLVDWLGKRAGVSRERAEALPDDVVEKLMESPRETLTTLLGISPKEHRLKELSAALMAVKPVDSTTVVPATTTDVELSPIEKEKKIRDPLWREGLEAARKVAEQTGDAEAASIHAFMLHNGIVCAPAQQGCTFLDEAKTAHWFSAVPLIQDDARLPMFADKVNSKSAVAFFLPDPRALILRSNEKMSPTWKGIISLHEGLHAKTYLEAPYNHRNPQIFCMHERKAHEFENRMLSLSGGNAYEVLLASEMGRMRSALLLEGKTPMDSFINSIDRSTALAAIFGASESDLERNTRNTHFWMNAMFRLYETTMQKADAERMKEQYLHAIYTRGGILPA